MAKINLKIKLDSVDENIDLSTTGIKQKNKKIYKENNITVTILILNNRIEMNRTCNEYKINLIFEKNKKTTSTYQVFGALKTFDLETYTNKLLIIDDKIVINYNLEGNDFSFVLEVIHENNIETRDKKCFK